MPFRSQRINNNFRNGLPALFALGTVAICMAIEAPSITFLFHKRGTRIEWLWQN